MSEGDTVAAELDRLATEIKGLRVYGEHKGWDFIKRTDVLRLVRGTAVERPAIIQGVLDQLPRDRAWTLGELAEWMATLEGALRVHYRLPRSSKGADTLPATDTLYEGGTE